MMDEQIQRMYDHMRKESSRLKTFQMNPPWPKDYIDIKKLAKAGFFYTFNGDKVQCAFCHGQVCIWDRDDDPMSEHARHFTTCPFIMGGEVGNEPLGEDPFPGPKRPRPYDVCGMHPNFPPNDPRSEDHQRDNNQHQSQQQQQLPPQAPPLQQRELQQPFNYNYVGNLVVNQDQVTNQNLAYQNYHYQPQQQAIRQQQLQRANDDLSSDCETRHSPSNTSNSSNSNISSSSNLNGICKICYTNSIELVFLPCGHSVSCLSCAQRLFCCPCCRATITTRIRTFLV